MHTGAEVNFEKQSTTFVSTQGVPYDYSSIMHYGPTDFAKNQNKPVIRAKNGATISGQRSHLTQSDIRHIQKAYCPNQLYRSG